MGLMELQQQGYSFYERRSNEEINQGLNTEEPTADFVGEKKAIGRSRRRVEEEAMIRKSIEW
jgi:hypothetical protein